MTALVTVALFALAALLSAYAAPIMVQARKMQPSEDVAVETASLGLSLAASGAVAAMSGAAILSSGELSPAGIAPFMLAVLAVGLPISISVLRTGSARETGDDGSAGD